MAKENSGAKTTYKSILSKYLPTYLYYSFWLWAYYIYFYPSWMQNVFIPVRNLFAKLIMVLLYF